MEAKELRIGNWLKLPSGKDFQIDHTDISLIANWNKEAPLPKPIPLTEEWLVRLGFFDGSDIIGDCWCINEHQVDQFVLYKEDEWFCYYTGSLMLEIESVHHLQNLYHSLTGKELTLTPISK